MELVASPLAVALDDQLVIAGAVEGPLIRAQDFFEKVERIVGILTNQDFRSHLRALLVSASGAVTSGAIFDSRR